MWQINVSHGSYNMYFVQSMYVHGTAQLRPVARQVQWVPAGAMGPTDGAIAPSVGPIAPSDASLGTLYMYVQYMLIA